MARWFRADLPAGADTAIHLLRAVELDWLLRHGVLYPRWAPDLVFGLGYPLFDVYGPGAQWVIVAFHSLGLSFVAATLAAFAAADVVGALGILALARALWGDLAGLMSAAAYAYAPYVLGSLYRGSTPEALALAVLPWLLWALYRLWHEPAITGLGLDGQNQSSWPSQKPRITGVALAAVCYALLPLLHNPTAVLGTALVAAWTGTLAWRFRAAPQAGRALRATMGALMLGLAISAVYWLPLLYDTRYIQLNRAAASGVLDYRNNFLTLRELFAWPQHYDPKLIEVAGPRSLGWPHLLLGAVGLAAGWRQMSQQRVLLGGAALGTLVLSLLTLAPARWVWERVPGMAVLQFPARLLGPASLLLALLVGAAAPFFQGLRGSDGVAAALTGLFLFCLTLYGLAWTFQHGDSLIAPNPTLADLHAFEQRTGTIGTTTAGEYLPIWVTEVPAADVLAERYDAAGLVRRLDAAYLPAGARVDAEMPGVLAERVALNTPVAFEARFDVFYFPGWRAWVDGRPTDIQIEAPYGLITVPVPAGAHTVEIAFGTTPVRVAGGIVSLAGLVVLLLILSRHWRRAGPRAGAESRRDLAAPQLITFGLVGLVLLVFKVSVIDRSETWFASTRFDGQQVAGVQNPLALTFGTQMQLMGYDLDRPSAPSGSLVNATLYWRALQALDKDYSVSLAATDAVGHRYAQADTQNPDGYPTSRWPVDAYGRDAHLLSLPAGMPPGVYSMVATVYHYPDLTPLGAGVSIGKLTVTRPERPAALSPDRAIRAPFGPIELTGVDLGRAETGAGMDWPVTLYWTARAAPNADYSARIGLVAPSGAVAAEQALAPAGDGYGTSLWAPGETLRAMRDVRLPASLPTGMYTVTVTLAGVGGALGAPAAIGNVHVTAPARSYAIPAPPHKSQARFGGLAELLGWDLQGSQLVLYWRALATSDRSYTVFVHIQDSAGALVSQRDAIPLSGARPTTTWLPGEVLTDVYPLQLPGGEYSLAVGLYDPATGERLPLAGGEDQLVLRP